MILFSLNFGHIDLNLIVKLIKLLNCPACGGMPLKAALNYQIIFLKV